MWLISNCIKKSIAFRLSLLWPLLLSITVKNTASAKPFSDTSNKVLPLSRNGNFKQETKDANVIFPAILCGNEKESLDYIEKFSVNRRDYIIRIYNKGKNYFPKVTGIFQKYIVPEELKVLLALESAFNGNAVSKAGAVGYWQIMDEVAREYGLRYVAHAKIIKKKTLPSVHEKSKHISTKDDRKNFNRSTHTAARYLKDRSKNLDSDWLLIVASYNCGVGNVWNAMEKSRKSNPTFWDIKDYLPAETRAYVMNFISLSVIFHNYEKFISNTLCFAPVKADMEEEKTDMVQTTTHSAATSKK